MCIPVETSYAAACDAALQLLNDPTAGLYYRCIPGETVAACLSMVNSGIVELAKLPARGIYQGYTQYNLQPIVNEVVSEDPAMKNLEGYAVAAVAPSWCASVDNGSQNPTLATLKGTNACFSGYQRDGGWQIPVGRLFLDGGMPVETKSEEYKDDAESVTDFFKDICAPGFYRYFPREDSKEYAKMCVVCGGGSECDTANPNYGSVGALTCLNTPENIVAFTEYPAIDTKRGAGTLTPTTAPPTPTPSPTPSPPVPVAAAPVPPAADATAAAAVPPTAEEPVEEPVAEPPKSPKAPKPPKPPKNEEDAPPAPDNGGKGGKDNNNNKDEAPAPNAGVIIPPVRRLLRHTSRNLLQKPKSPPPAEAPAAGGDYAAAAADEEDTGASGGGKGVDETVAPPLPTTPAVPVVVPTVTPTPTPTPATPTTPEVDPNSVPLTALLCPKASNPNDNCRPMSEFATCNLGYIPAQAFVATETWANSDQGNAVKEALVLAGSGSNPNFMNAAAKAGLAPYWLITPGTLRLSAVDVSAKDYLGSEFIDTMSAVDKVMSGQINPDVEAAAASGSSDGGGGLSTAAIIAIVVVSIVVVGGAIAGGVIYHNNKKKKQGWKKYQDAVRDIQRI